MELRRKVALVAGLYFIEGFPMGIFSDVWPVFLRDAGTGVETIGWISWLGFAWTAKALWSPAVDGIGEWRHWISIALVVMAGMVALAPAAADSPAVVAVIALFCLASATQDIAIDASAVALTKPGEEGLLSSVRVSVYRVGAITFGMGGPLLAEQLGWSALHAVLAMAIAPLAIGALALPRLQSPRERSRESPWRALEFFGRPAALGALCFLVFYRLGDLAMAPMIRVFWRDSGASLTLIGLVPNGISALVGIAGSLLGGVLVARVSLGRALGIGGVLASASNAAYAAAAWAGAPLPAVVAASLAESACSGVAGVALVSLLVAACERAHAGVQFAVLTALSPAAGRLLGGPSGEFVAAYGYGAWFALTGALTLPALAFVPAVVRWADARPDRQSTVA